MIDNHKKGVLIISPAFSPNTGGVETHLSILLPEMVRLGHNVSLLTGNANGIKMRYDYKGVHIRRNPLMNLQNSNLKYSVRRSMSGYQCLSMTGIQIKY